MNLLKLLLEKGVRLGWTFRWRAPQRNRGGGRGMRVSPPCQMADFNRPKKNP